MHGQLNKLPITSIPTDLYEGVGLIGEGMSIANELELVDIPQYLFPSVTILISTILGGKISCSDVHPSCLFIKVGRPGSWKSEVDHGFMDLVKPKFDISQKPNPIYGTTDLASYKSLPTAVKKRPHGLILFDEISSVDLNKSKQLKALWDMSEKADNTLGKKQYTINFMGNTQPVLLKENLLKYPQGFDFWCYDDNGAFPRASFIHDITAPSQNKVFSKSWLNKLVALYGVKKPPGSYDTTIDSATDIGMDNEVMLFMMDYTKALNNVVNEESDDNLRRIISRREASAIKFALVHVGATRNPEDIFKPIALADIEWGAKIADIQSAWKLNVFKTVS